MPTVLLVDDAELTRNILSKLLDKEGYATLTAANGTEALHVLWDHPRPDLIVLDVNMPDMDGLDLLQVLHENPQWQAIPVVMLTAACDTASVNRAKQLGAREYLVKAACSAREMLGAVRHYAEGLEH